MKYLYRSSNSRCCRTICQGFSYGHK